MSLLADLLADTIAVDAAFSENAEGFDGDNNTEFDSSSLDFVGGGDVATDDFASLATEAPTYTPTEVPDYWPAHLMWIQKTFSTLSILASYVICREIVANLRRQRQQSGRRTSVSGDLSGGSSNQPSIAKPRNTAPRHAGSSTSLCG